MSAEPKLVPLSQGQSAIVDEADFERVSKFKWYAWWNKASKSFYAMRNLTPRGSGTQYMHNYITGFCFVDHADHNGLNNQRSNLRKSNAQTNMRNRKPYAHPGGTCNEYKGVGMKGDKYRARIRLSPNKQIQIGTFDTAEQAARAYDEAAIKHFGEFAYLNFRKD